MADEFNVSPETAALAAMAGRVVNATLDSALEGDLAAFEAEVDAAVSEALPPLPDDDGARQEDKANLFKQAMRVHSQAVKAIREGREEDRKILDAEYAALQARIKEIGRYHGFTAQAERLHRAKGFDDFIATLPHVDLKRLYGGAAPALPPFPLIWAMEARDRQVERVQAMLIAGARLDLTTKFPRSTVLHWLAQSRRKTRDSRLACVRLLILKGADLEACDMFGRTPLHVAISEGSVDDLAVLLAAGADVRALSGNRELGSIEGQSRTSLMKAAGDPGKVRLLLDHGADPRQLAADGMDLRQFLRQQVAQVETWLVDLPEKKREGSSFNKRRIALLSSQAQLVPLMGAPAADPDRKLTFQEAPEAFYALRQDVPLETYRRALARIDVTTFKAPNGDCPIYWPIRAKADRLQRLWLMLQTGASVEGHPANGTAMHIFADEGRRDVEEQVQMARMLVQAGAGLEALDYNGLTPLARAVQHAAVVEVKALLAVGASVRARGSLGFVRPRVVPLLWAAAHCGPVFRQLIQHGADPDERAPDGQTIDKYVASEIMRLESDLAGELSPGLRRKWQQFLRGFNASRTLLARVRATKSF